METIDKPFVDDNGYMAYEPEFGAFALGHETANAIVLDGGWRECREDFAGMWENVETAREIEIRDIPDPDIIMYVHNQDNLDLIAEFVTLTEQKLGIKYRSKISKLPKRALWGQQFIFIKLATWWKKSTLRKQFLTAMLRAARYYKNPAAAPTAKREKVACDLVDSYENALYSVIYFSSTKPAVKYFMQGNTIWDDNSGIGEMHKGQGWMRYFYTNGYNPENLLRKPLKRKK